MAFTKAQQVAIEHKDGPMLVIAGPGSGKTTVLTHRILHLVKDCQIPPETILVITFTRAAAREMEGRYGRLRGKGEGERTGRIRFGTFHSVFFGILKEFSAEDGRKASGWKIAEEKECLQILRRVMKRFYPGKSYGYEYYEHLLDAIGRIKNGMETPDPVARKLIEPYDEELERAGFIDFDDMLARCLTLIRKRKDVLIALRKRFRYIMVDEFQDINPVQFEIVREIAAPLNNLFVVGDDDQSIYAFRGSDPEIMLRFPNLYPDAAIAELTQNFRSSGNIVRASARLIRYNRRRYKKHLFTGREKGAKLSVLKYRDAWEEAAEVLGSISLLPAGTSAAVLYRTHRAGYEVSRLLEEIQNGSSPALGKRDPGDLRRALSDKKVRLMTFHASKGLEFDAVFLIRAEEGSASLKNPQGNAAEAGLEEERRMFYVAMTRARSFLQISYTASGRGVKRSRFVREALGLPGFFVP